MHSDLHGNVVHHGVELLLLVSMLFLPAIPKSPLILKEFLYTSSLIFLALEALSSQIVSDSNCITAAGVTGLINYRLSSLEGQ